MRQKQMPGRTGSLKRRKGKCTVALSNPEARGSHKVFVKRRDVKRAKTEMADTKTEMSQSDSVVGFCSELTTTSERLISCECHERAEKTSCGSPPTLEEQEGKENKVRTRLDLDPCRTNGFPEKMEGEDVEESVEIDISIFPDDDSNQILPVEQFFGNLEVVQDCPHRSSTTSAWSRREHRRRHYYAKEDSNEEEGCAEMQQDDEGGS